MSAGEIGVPSLFFGICESARFSRRPVAVVLSFLVSRSLGNGSRGGAAAAGAAAARTRAAMSVRGDERMPANLPGILGRMPGPFVDVWADPICPFCYVALERADWLAERYDAQIRWHPFDLHPEYPPDGIPREVLDARYGEDMRRAVREMIEGAGLPLAELPRRVPNSRRAQRVAISAGERFGELYRRYVDAYF